jgi:hypothetical protein
VAILKHRVKLTWNGAGSPGVNTWHSEIDEVLASDAQAITDTLKNFYTAIASLLRPGLTVTYDENPYAVDTLEEFETTGWTVTSTGSSVIMPAPVMACVAWKTALRARRAMGRTFIGPLSNAVDGTDGTLAAGALTTLNNAAQALVTASNSHVGNALGVYGYRDAKPKDQVRTGLEPKDFRPFTSGSVQDKYAVLRSRRD